MRRAIGETAMHHEALKLRLLCATCVLGPLISDAHWRLLHVNSVDPTKLVAEHFETSVESPG